MADVIQDDCPLCRWADDPDQRVVCRNDFAIFLQNPRQQGALVGSGVIIPVRHRETVFDLTLEEVAASFQLLAQVKRWMDATYAPQGYNVGWNCGRVGGQDVMHAHMHVIPRFAQEPYAGRGIRYWLKQDANRWR
jgi:diadenosine tetraphosphate (Ap4A) HIT family hydrolase